MDVLEKIRNFLKKLLKWSSLQQICRSTYDEDIKNISKKEIASCEKIFEKMSEDDIIRQLPDSIKKEVDKIIAEYEKMLKNDKPILLIIDDNIGLISLIEDIIEIHGLENKINVLKIYSSYAGFIFKILEKRFGKIKIDYAVIDITYGGVMFHPEKGNVKYEGIMVFKEIYKHNPDLKFFFYTGNNLNPYVYSSKKIIESFKEITGEDIFKYTIFKNQYPPSQLIEIISNILSNKKEEQ